MHGRCLHLWGVPARLWGCVLVWAVHTAIVLGTCGLWVVGRDAALRLKRQQHAEGWCCSYGAPLHTVRCGTISIHTLLLVPLTVVPQAALCVCVRQQLEVVLTGLLGSVQASMATPSPPLHLAQPPAHMLWGPQHQQWQLPAPTHVVHCGMSMPPYLHMSVLPSGKLVFGQHAVVVRPLAGGGGKVVCSSACALLSLQIQQVPQAPRQALSPSDASLQQQPQGAPSRQLRLRGKGSRGSRGSRTRVRGVLLRAVLTACAAWLVVVSSVVRLGSNA
jgi:hypothetical protein